MGISVFWCLRPPMEMLTRIHQKSEGRRRIKLTSLGASLILMRIRWPAYFRRTDSDSSAVGGRRDDRILLPERTDIPKSGRGSGLGAPLDFQEVHFVSARKTQPRAATTKLSHCQRNGHRLN